MRIQSAEIALHSQRTQTEAVNTRLLTATPQALSSAAAVSAEQDMRPADVVYSDPRRSVPASSITALGRSDLLQLSAEDQLKLTVLNKLYESLTGKHLIQLETETPQQRTYHDTTTVNMPAPQRVVEPFALWEQTRVRTERVSFEAQGSVTTSDGRQINLTLSLNLRRELAEQQQIQARLGAVLQDPLVVNYAANSAALAQDTYQFDIDLDGELETVHRLARGSGYLALDRNANGQIDDGNELFGARTGDGFAELAQWDEDGNGFIDEGDSVFSRLMLWIQESDGESRLEGLAAHGIGALYLGHAQTDWTLAAGENAAGQLRSTGLFLRESGGAGTLQHVDLMV